MKFYTLLTLVVLSSVNLYAGRISGRVTNGKNAPLAFASVVVKGTLKGTTTNNDGVYSIHLDEGDYLLLIQHIGYKTIERKVSVSKADLVLNFELAEQQYELGNVTVKRGEDPAYEIIRNAIKKRRYYETENKKYQTEVYIKGQLKLRDFPSKFMGSKVDFEDGDSSKKKMLFLSESVAKYSVDEPESKIEVISTRVSGQKDAFGFSSPYFFSFYQNIVKLNNLNPRGFISPISNNALNYYKYKFEGTFFENNQMINRIRVIPRRKYEPLFDGFINIVEDSWRIQSVALVLYKENQMQLVDTLRIEQLYIPSGNTWVIKQQAMYPAIKFLGFDATGYFVQVYDKFNLNPVFPKNFFDNTFLKFQDSANKKPVAYWDTLRPLPLLEEEVKDYKKKDSLEVVRKDPHYLDSLDRIRNKPNFMMMISRGQEFSIEKKKTTVNIPPLLNEVQFNTVEGWVVQISPTYEKRFSDAKRNKLTISPHFRYGFSNKHFNSYLSSEYRFGKKYFSAVSLSGGKRLLQFDNAGQIAPMFNTLSTLQYKRNYLKIYEAWFGKAGLSKEVGEGVILSGTLEYQDRMPLENTDYQTWRKWDNRTFSPNITFDRHQALTGTFNIRWKPGTKYIEFPERKISIGSRYPTFVLSYTKGFKDIAGSDVDYSRWDFSVNDDLNMKLFGSLRYRLTAGGFLNTKSAFFQDYKHFNGNQIAIASNYLESFQLMPYYAYSNKDKFYSAGHVEYHLNGLLTNKIPGFKRLNWFLVGGANALYLKSGAKYSEAFVGLENILKIFRIDYVRSFSNDINDNRRGIRISLPVFATSNE